MKHIILLTSCVNPNGMPFTALSDINVRKQQYLDALRFYVNTTPLPIVYVDNSNVDIKEYNVISNIVDDRLELLSFDGNHDKEHGKGYGELEIIDYAIKHSNIINSNKNVSIIKITGRLVIVNIMTIINQLKAKNKSRMSATTYDFNTYFKTNIIQNQPARLPIGTTKCEPYVFDLTCSDATCR